MTDTDPSPSPLLAAGPRLNDRHGVEASAPIPPGTAPRTRLLRWLVRLRTVLWVSALIAVAVYFVGGMRPGVRLAVFGVYGLVATGYIGLYFYMLTTRRAPR